MVELLENEPDPPFIESVSATDSTNMVPDGVMHIRNIAAIFKKARHVISRKQKQHL